MDEHTLNQIMIVTASRMPIAFDGQFVSIDRQRLKDELFSPLTLHRIFQDRVAEKFRQPMLDEALSLMDWKAPVISTPVNGADNYTRFMAYRPRSLNTANNLIDCLKWEGLRRSFEVSNAPCVDLPVLNHDPSSLLWMRDPCLIMGHVAFFPDNDLMDSYYCTKKQIANERKTALQRCEQLLRQQGLKIVVVKGCAFEGGNLIPAAEAGFLFCGQIPGRASENIQPLCDAIARYTDFNLTPVYVPIDNEYFFHLDIGMSRELPNGKFLVCRNLGPNLNGDGYKTIERHLGPSSLYTYEYNHRTRLMANLDVMGNGVMMTQCDDDTRHLLERNGIIVNAPSAQDDGSREIGMGGVSCLSNEACAYHLQEYQRARAETRDFSLAGI